MKATVLLPYVLCMFAFHFTNSLWQFSATTSEKHDEGSQIHLPDGYSVVRCTRIARQTTSTMLICLNKDDEPILLTISFVKNLSNFNPFERRPPPLGKYLILERTSTFPSLMFPLCLPLMTMTSQKPSSQHQGEQFGGVFECRDNNNNNNNSTLSTRIAMAHHIVHKKRWIEVLLEENTNGSIGESGPNERKNDSEQSSTVSVEDSGGKIIDPAMFIGTRDGFASNEANIRPKNVPAGANKDNDEGHNGKRPNGKFMKNEQDWLSDGSKRDESGQKGERNDCIDENDPRCDLEDVRSEDN